MWVRVMAASIIAVAASLGCTCAGGGKYGCAVPAADVVVLARVVSIEQKPRMPVNPDPQTRVWGGVTVTLKILERFRGPSSDPLVVRTESSSTACGYAFQAGKEYIVFAEASQGGLLVSYCSATQPAKAAASRIRQLRAVRDGTALPSLFGSVLTHPVEQGEDRDEYVQPVPNLTVVAQSGGQEYRASTAQDGVYEFHHIPRGEYFVQVEAPAGRKVDWRGGGERVRTPAGLDPRCPIDFEVFDHGRREEISVF
jgi:hypothetical protein